LFRIELSYNKIF